jgi:hypothetical protein
MDPARWASTLDVLLSEKVIVDAPKLPDSFTNKYIGPACQ